MRLNNEHAWKSAVCSDCHTQHFIQLVNICLLVVGLALLFTSAMFFFFLILCPKLGMLVCDDRPPGVRRQAACCVSSKRGTSSILGIFWARSFYHIPHPALQLIIRRLNLGMFDVHTAVKNIDILADLDVSIIKKHSLEKVIIAIMSILFYSF